jgi:hypothetical protein
MNELDEGAGIDPAVANAALEQRALSRLGLHDLQARWARQPPQDRITFGAGEQAEQTLPGNPSEGFHGLAIFNPTGKTIKVGFGPGNALGSALIVPPHSGVVWAAEFTNLSLAVSAAEAARLAETIVVLRLFYPPSQPQAFPYGVPAAAAVVQTPEDITVKGASIAVVAANPLRIGLEVVNRGANAVRLMPGSLAENKHGLWLAKEGGTWNGMISSAVWLGSVNAICEVGETTLGVVEV